MNSLHSASMIWEMAVGRMLECPWAYPRREDMQHTNSADGASTRTHSNALGLDMAWVSGFANTDMITALIRPRVKKVMTPTLKILCT